MIALAAANAVSPDRLLMQRSVWTAILRRPISEDEMNRLLTDRDSLIRFHRVLHQSCLNCPNDIFHFLAGIMPPELWHHLKELEPLLGGCSCGSFDHHFYAFLLGEAPNKEAAPMNTNQIKHLWRTAFEGWLENRSDEGFQKDLSILESAKSH